MFILWLILYTLAAAAGIAGLYYGAEFLVKGGVALARRAGVSSLVIGLTLVAAATSAPELVVSVSAALDGNSDISLGNVVGSNICNIALILGLSSCIVPLTVKKQLLKTDLPVMIGSAVLLSIFYFFNRGVNRWQAGLLLAGFFAYTVWSIYVSMKENSEQEEEKNENLMTTGKALLLIIVSLILLVAGAKLFLISAIWFARLMKISDAVIGLTVVAVGTSLPELATSVVAACRKEADIAVGNVVGSNIFNILAILGVAPLVSPMSNAKLNMFDLGMMLLCSIILLPMLRTNWKLSRAEGAFLLLLYAVYTGYLIACPR